MTRSIKLSILLIGLYLMKCGFGDKPNNVLAPVVYCDSALFIAKDTSNYVFEIFTKHQCDTDLILATIGCYDKENDRLEDAHDLNTLKWVNKHSGGKFQIQSEHSDEYYEVTIKLYDQDSIEWKLSDGGKSNMYYPKKIMLYSVEQDNLKK